MSQQLLGLHQRHACSGDDCMICRNGLHACAVCNGVAASLPGACPGRPLSKRELAAIADYRLDVVADQNGIWLYGIDQDGHIYARRDTDNTAVAVTAGEIKAVHLAVGSEGKLAVMFEGGALIERRENEWHRVKLAKPALYFGYEDGDLLTVMTDDGYAFWNGREFRRRTHASDHVDQTVYQPAL